MKYVLPTAISIFTIHQRSCGKVLLSYVSVHQSVSLSMEDPCCDMSQNDTIAKIELNPSFVLSSDTTNYKNDIQ